ncbi:hypothetical protein BGX26_006320, partial [Mortierella sp. AD094]
MSEEGKHEVLQVFRAVCKDETSRTTTPLTESVAIKPWFINKSGEHVILWNDVKTAFKNPVHVMSKDVVLPFLTDENSKVLQPLRISAHPGVVLDVTIENPRIEEDMESLRIKGSPTSPASPASPSTSSSIPGNHSSSEIFSAASSSSPSAAIESINQTQQSRIEQQDRRESQETTTLSESESNDRAHQLVPDYNDGRFCLYDETQPVLENEHHSGVSACIRNEGNVDEDYVRGLAYYEGNNIRQDY